MKRTRGRPLLGVTAALLLCIALFLWQWQNLARLAIGAAAATVAHVDVTFENLTIAPDRAVFDQLRVQSFRGEPIAAIDRLAVTFDLRELFTGRRLFGLKAIDADTPRLSVIRRPDGTYNIPIPQLAARQPGGQPLAVALAP